MRWLVMIALAVGSLSSSCKEEAPPAPTPTDKEHATAVAEGDPAPDVTLRLHDGSELSLSSLEGSLVFLYFYPKDDTPGCTVEAQGLRDEHDALTELGVKVYGISTQDAESHKSFIDKHDLPFPLVIDDDGKVAKAFNVPVKGGFAARHSFLIGKDGKLLRVWRTVQPAQHAKEVLIAARNASS